MVVLPANMGPTMTWTSPHGEEDWGVSICDCRIGIEKIGGLGEGIEGFAWRNLGYETLGGFEGKEKKAKGLVLGK